MWRAGKRQTIEKIFETITYVKLFLRRGKSVEQCLSVCPIWAICYAESHHVDIVWHQYVPLTVPWTTHSESLWKIWWGLNGWSPTFIIKAVIIIMRRLWCYKSLFELIKINSLLSHFFLLTCMFGFCELMSALARSGKFLKSRMKGLVSSSGSGCGRTPTDLCWWWGHLLWWLWGSGRRLWTWFCCSKASGAYWTPPPWIRWPLTYKCKMRGSSVVELNVSVNSNSKWDNL